MSVPTMTEKDLQATVEQCATLLGWRIHHHWISIRSSPGWPDLVLVRPPRLMVVELKRDGVTPTPAQQEWLDDLAACGVDVRIWRPAGWLSGAIERELR